MDFYGRPWTMDDSHSFDNILNVIVSSIQTLANQDTVAVSGIVEERSLSKLVTEDIFVEVMPDGIVRVSQAMGTLMTGWAHGVLRCLSADIRSWPSFRASMRHPSNRLGVNGFVHGSNTEGSNSYLLQQPLTAEGSDNFVALEDIALISASSASSADLMSPAGLPRRSRRRRTNAYGRWCR